MIVFFLFCLRKEEMHVKIDKNIIYLVQLKNLYLLSSCGFNILILSIVFYLSVGPSRQKSGDGRAGGVLLQHPEGNG